MPPDTEAVNKELLPEHTTESLAVIIIVGAEITFTETQAEIAAQF